MSKDFEPKHVNIFLPTILYMCFGCPKEPSKGDHNSICFGREIKKYYALWLDLEPIKLLFEYGRYRTKDSYCREVLHTMNAFEDESHILMICP